MSSMDALHVAGVGQAVAVLQDAGQMQVQVGRPSALVPVCVIVRLGGQNRDTTGRRPSIWFQPTEAHEVPRQRWHWVLADPQGNRACLTTWQGRESLGA
jgi:hypothetical protein